MAKIIIADDTLSSLIILKTILASKGHEVFTFNNGQDVLDNFINIEPDAILLDVQMPNMSGIEVCQELRKRPESYNIPIAMISGHDSENEIVDGLTSGADLYILKPIHADEVISKLSLLLNKRGNSTGTEMAENVVFASYFKIKKILGSGGYSSVYLAEDFRNGNLVALKILDTHQASKRYISQFLREAYGLSRINHPNIVKLIHFGNFGNKYYLVTEFIEGDSLDKIVQKELLTEDKALDIAEKLHSALKYLNTRDIIHRDIKPGNILISPEGRIVLVDFGLAREKNQNTLSLDGEMQGTPHILSPEYIKDENLTYKVDIYSLGATLFQAVSGHFPFESNDPIAVIQAHLDQTPPRLIDVKPDVSPVFSYMIERMLVKNPQKRCSLQELSELIKRCRNKEPIDFKGQQKEVFRSPEFDYHLLPIPGKFSTETSKVIENYHDLSYAIAQGSKNISLEIHNNPQKIWDYSSKSNLVAMLGEGSSVYNMEDASPEVAIPAMEGYASVIKKFSNINAIPLALDIKEKKGNSSSEQMLTLIEQLSPSFGAFMVACSDAKTAFSLVDLADKKLNIPVYNERYISIAVVILGNLLYVSSVMNRKLDSYKIAFNQINGYSKALFDLLQNMGLEELYLANQNGYKKLTKIDNKDLKKNNQKLPEIIEKDFDILLDFTGNESWLKHAIPYMPDKSIIISLTPYGIDSIKTDNKVFIPLDISFPELLTSLITPGLLRGALDVQLSSISNDIILAVAEKYSKLLAEKNAEISIEADESENIPTPKLEQTEERIINERVIQPNIFQIELITDIAATVVETAVRLGVNNREIDDIDYYSSRLEESLNNS